MSDSGLEKFILDKLEKLDDKLDQVREESSKLSHSLIHHESKDHEIHQDVKKMAEKFGAQLDEQCKALHEYNLHLQEHMKRSDELERSHKKMWERVQPVVNAHEDEVTVKKWLSSKAKSRLKLIAAIGTAAGSIAAVLKLIGMI